MYVSDSLAQSCQSFEWIQEKDCNEHLLRRLFSRATIDSSRQSLFGLPHKLKLEILRKLVDILLKKFDNMYICIILVFVVLLVEF